MKQKFNLTQEQNIFLAKKALISNIYNSAKLEGLNVTYPDTQTILDGVNVPTVKLEDITCILNLRDAWKEVLSTINNTINLEYICRINFFVSRNESLEWGKLRTGEIGITGTKYKPNILNEKDVKEKVEELNKIESNTEKAIKFMLYIMYNQLFWDGNKRTSMLVANKIMIENGCGIISIKEEHLLEFNKLLTNFYETNNDKEIIEYIYNNCIYGLEVVS